MYRVHYNKTCIEQCNHLAKWVIPFCLILNDEMTYSDKMRGKKYPTGISPKVFAREVMLFRDTVGSLFQLVTSGAQQISPSPAEL